MAKKRGFSDNESDGPKKRSPNSRPTTPCVQATLKQERNILNDSVLSLYKKELIDKKDMCTIQNEEVPEIKEKGNDVANSKTPRIGKRAKSAVLTPKYSTVKFADVGGMETILRGILRIFFYYKDPLGLQKVGFSPTRGILLHGPPGCGKTHLARAIAGQFGLPFIEVAATELVCGISGESESKIRDVFDAAVASGRCILFIDEIDSICPKRETTDSAMLRRMVAQMIKCLDELYVKDTAANVLVVGATNMPDSIDPALRRGLRFDREFAIGIPNEEARFEILKVICKNIRLSPDFDLRWLAHNSPGYVGADLRTLASSAMEAGYSRLYEQFIESCHSLKTEENPSGKPSGEEVQTTTRNRSLEDEITWFESFKVPEEGMENFYIKLEDFQAALRMCVPYSKREGFASVPDTTWSDIGALEDIKKELRSTIMWPVQYSQFYEDNNLSSTKGILLYGPKGCGKTLLAKAIANECSINFLSVNGPELLSMYVGESEKAVRKCFERARNSAPCIIFFDEFDALCPPRSSSKENAPVERVVNQLLTETCGMQERKQVFLVAATNRIEKIDSAMLRPGRLEKILYVGLPSPAGRVEILKSLTKNKTRPKIDNDLELEKIALDDRCADFSGADLAYLVREAISKAMEEMINKSSTLSDLVLYMKHFDEALNVVKPSFSEQDRKYFQKSTSHNPRT